MEPYNFCPVIMEPQIASSQHPWLPNKAKRKNEDISEDLSSNLKIVASVIAGIFSISFMLQGK